MSLARHPALLKLPPTLRTLSHVQCRYRHAQSHSPLPRIPQPTPFVPDVPTFLTLIGRNLSAHAAKIPSWEALFTLSGAQLREAGVEPARARRYLLWWRERFRNGIRGIGGDLKEVQDGVAELRLVEVPSERGVDKVATLNKGAGMRKIVVNTLPSLPVDMSTSEGENGDAGEDVPAKSLAPPPSPADLKNAAPVTGVKVLNATTISGRGVQLVKGRQGIAQLKVQEGLWENRRGHKVDGGERRKAEVRAKRRVQERKNAR